MIRRFNYLFILAAVLFVFTACNKSKYDCESVDGDPMGVQIYTLKNGLKIYMSVNKEQPRIQTAIAVRAGAKNEPEESTGLAHYLEHVMFKGTEQFGTQNYTKEKPMLDEIERLYEVYRKTTDPAERKAIYHQIDSVSFEASKLAIPNEYDKLMATIGSDGSNAFTSYDVTCYVEDIPSNQIDNWAKIQADRFKHMIIRGFHTELEAVYEEYNGGLTEDWDKMHDTIATVLFPSHPYKRGIIGKQEHLKSPSITNIKKFFNTYYVPNNIAICVSGDFDPDEMIATIEKYFGDMPENKNLPKFEYKKDPELKSPVSKTVLSPQEEYISLAWRFDGAASIQQDTLDVVSDVFSNGTAGLFDIDINLKHKALQAMSNVDKATDYSTFELRAYPMPGQSLDELKNLILSEVKKVREGKFNDELVEAVINNLKLEEQQSLENNEERVNSMVNAFINGASWSDVVGQTDRQSHLTKKDVVAFVKKHLCDNNFVAVYKRKGADPNIVPVEKPAITPIMMNRDVMSPFVKSITESKVTPIEPVFLDFSKDITKGETASHQPVVYTENKINKVFSLNFIYDMGSYADQTLSIAASYLDYIGTDSLSAVQIREAFYRLGCSFDVKVTGRRTYLHLSGLDENLPQAVALYEHIMSRVRPDKNAWGSYCEALMQSRSLTICNFDSYIGAMRQYLRYGQDYMKQQNVSNARLATLSPDSLVLRIKAFSNIQHEVSYYGPRSMDDIVGILNADIHEPSHPVAPMKNKEWVMVKPTESKVFFVPFAETMNFDLTHYCCQGDNFNADLMPVISLYQEYFSGGMNSVVFQDMREKKALVYGANAHYYTPSYSSDYSFFASYAESQSDKLADVMTTFNGIINDMPQVEASFSVAKDALIARLRTQRTTGEGIIWAYYGARDLGIDYDINSNIYNKVQNLTMKDIVAFQQKYIKSKPCYYGFAGNKSALDFSVLQKLGPVTEISPSDIFGF